MNILLLMDPFIPVPPIYYGGIERVVYDIACEYSKLGHNVTLIAGPNSKSPDRLIIYGENGPGSVKLNYKYLAKLSKIFLQEIPKHDVIHNFGRLAFLFPIAWNKIAKVHTYMRYIDVENIKKLNHLKVKNIVYTAVSNAIVKTGISGGGTWKTIYNCSPIDQFNFNPSIDFNKAPLVFLGRLERCKGCHTAIKVAKITGKQLLIAGNISELSHEKTYFEEELKPLFDDNQIKYIGVVDNKAKNELLRNASAMLLPIEWYEPFPIVLPEAFACGTPILAFPNGGVGEGIINGITGFISNSAEEMAEQVNQIPEISRHRCRMEAENRFSDKVIANEYIKIYESLINKK